MIKNEHRRFGGKFELNGELLKSEFEVLKVYACCSDNRKLTQRYLHAKTGFSLGKINGVIKSLTDKCLINDGVITNLGLKKLEPYRAKRAVFLAAGFGSRLAPITLTTPKPLVKVNGKRIIDGLIDSVLAAGIDEIYVVRGYLSDKFNELLNKYPKIKFIDNPIYNISNNISSAYFARKYFENAYILESDLVINNYELICPYQYDSNFLGFKVDKTDDWCFEVKKGCISAQKIGGINCFQEFGISYWDEESGQNLGRYIEELFNSPGGKECFWDYVPFGSYKRQFKVSIRECRKDDFVEIDTLEDLRKIDKNYEIEGETK